MKRGVRTVCFGKKKSQNFQIFEFKERETMSAFEKFMGKVLRGTTSLPDPANREPPPAPIPEVDHRPPELIAVQNRFGRNQRVGTASNWQKVNGPDHYINTHELLRLPDTTQTTQKLNGPIQWRRTLLIATIGVALTSAALILIGAVITH